MIKDNLHSIKSLLDKTFGNSTSWQLKLAAQWPDLVGNLANIMSLEKIYGGTLIVGVYEQSWIHELYMLSDMIIKTINKELEGAKIEKIQFKLATKKEVVVPKKSYASTPQQYDIRLNTREELALNIIKDLELREVLKSFLISCKKRNAHRKPV